MRRLSLLLFTFATLILLPGTVAAQDWNDDDDGFEISGLTVEVNAGAADYGRFLEQSRVLVLAPGGGFSINGQRELTAETAITIGGSIGTWFQDDLGVRLGVTYNPTQFIFEGDPSGVTNFDADEVADLSAFTLSLEVLKFLIDPEENRFAPYANAGVAAGWWDLGEDEDGAGVSSIIARGEETQLRWGGVGGIGLQIGLTRSFAARLEFSTFGLGNPFDGDEPFRVADGGFVTMDEPDNVRISRLTVGLAYTFGGDD